MYAKGKANYAPPEEPPSETKGFFGSMVLAGIGFLILAFGLDLGIRIAGAISIPLLAVIVWAVRKGLGTAWADYYARKREWDNSWYCEHCTRDWVEQAKAR